MPDAAKWDLGEAVEFRAGLWDEKRRRGVHACCAGDQLHGAPEMEFRWIRILRKSRGEVPVALHLPFPLPRIY